jgi:hypothetical protein
MQNKSITYTIHDIKLLQEFLAGFNDLAGLKEKSFSGKAHKTLWQTPD